MNIAVIVLLGGTVLGALGALFLNRGAKALRFNRTFLRRLLHNWEIFLGIGIYCLSFAPYIYALSILPLSVAYPLTSLTYVWSALLAKKYLNEEVDAWRWGGILSIILGITLLAA